MLRPFRSPLFTFFSLFLFKIQLYVTARIEFIQREATNPDVVFPSITGSKPRAAGYDRLTASFQWRHTRISLSASQSLRLWSNCIFPSKWSAIIHEEKATTSIQWVISRQMTVKLVGREAKSIAAGNFLFMLGGKVLLCALFTLEDVLRYHLLSMAWSVKWFRIRIPDLIFFSTNGSKGTPAKWSAFNYFVVSRNARLSNSGEVYFWVYRFFPLQNKTLQLGADSLLVCWAVHLDTKQPLVGFLSLQPLFFTLRKKRADL